MNKPGGEKSWPVCRRRQRKRIILRICVGKSFWCRSYTTVLGSTVVACEQCHSSHHLLLLPHFAWASDDDDLLRSPDVSQPHSGGGCGEGNNTETRKTYGIWKTGWRREMLAGSPREGGGRKMTSSPPGPRERAERKKIHLAPLRKGGEGARRRKPVRSSARWVPLPPAARHHHDRSTARDSSNSSGDAKTATERSILLLYYVQ